MVCRNNQQKVPPWKLEIRHPINIGDKGFHKRMERIWTQMNNTEHSFMGQLSGHKIKGGGTISGTRAPLRLFINLFTWHSENINGIIPAVPPFFRLRLLNPWSVIVQMRVLRKR
jgi:hypothetical protein